MAQFGSGRQAWLAGFTPGFDLLWDLTLTEPRQNGRLEDITQTTFGSYAPTGTASV